MGSVLSLMDHVRPTTPAEACQAFYIFASASILGINVLPADLRSALMDYGARLQDSSKKTPGKLAWIPGLLRVPHSWFLHYYILSLACSAFWAWQYLTRGSVMEWLVKGQVRDGRESVELLQVFVAWGLMTLQGLRRLYESFFVTKPGPSPMSSIHWIVGLVYYLDMSISVWIEGSGAILDSWSGIGATRRVPPRLPIAIGLFLAGWIKQNQCHKHLASLKKYTLPDQGWFQRIVCPHYTSECLVYLGLTLAAAPPGKVVNRTILTGLMFVAVNLGTTASSTKKWYSEKFGPEKVASKWKMIPFVF